MSLSAQEWIVTYRRVRPFWMTDAAWKLKSSEWKAKFSTFQEAYAFASKNTERRAIDVEGFKSSRGVVVSRQTWEQMYRAMTPWDEALASVAKEGAATDG